MSTRIAYCHHRAMVVVGGASVRLYHGATTMLIIGIVLSFVVLAYLCWLLFTLAVHALPFFAGVTAGVAPPHTCCRAARRDHRRPDREQHHLRCRTDRLHNGPLAAHPGSNRTPLRGAGCRR